MNRELAKQIILEIYREMYKKSEPSADLDELISSGETKQPGWFLGYFLDTDLQDHIIVEICKKYKLSESDRRRIYNECMRGCSPTGDMSVMLKHRK